MNCPLLFALLDRHFRIANLFAEFIRRIDDTVPKSIHGSIQVIQVNARGVFQQQQSNRDSSTAREALNIMTVKQFVFLENELDERGQLSFAARIAKWS